MARKLTEQEKAERAAKKAGAKNPVEIIEGEPMLEKAVQESSVNLDYLKHPKFNKFSNKELSK